MSRRDGPHVMIAQNNGCIRVLLTQWESLVHAIETEAVWWAGTSIYGGEVMVRISSITDCYYLNAETLSAVRDEEHEESIT